MLDVPPSLGETARSAEGARSSKVLEVQVLLGGRERVQWVESVADGEDLWGTYDDSCSPQLREQDEGSTARAAAKMKWA